MRRWIVRGMWALVVVLPGSVLLLWWLGTIPEAETPAIGRTVFGNIPEPLVVLYYVASIAFVGVFAYLFALRVRNWDRGAFEERAGRWWRRIREVERA